MKSNKGITLVALVITIIIIIIIAAITVYEGNIIVGEAKYEDVKTDMLLIQAEVKNFVEQARFEHKSLEDIKGAGKGITKNGVTLEFGEPNNLLTGKINDAKSNSNKTQNMYQILSNMDSLKLNNINPEKYFISIDIDNVDVDVLYVQGIKGEDGRTYYFLSDMEK